MTYDRLQGRFEELSSEERELFGVLVQKEGDGADGWPMTGQEVAAPLPLSFAQERFWFLHEFEAGSPAYNVPMAFRFTGRLEPDVLERSLSFVVQRHQILRARFPALDGKPSQAIGSADEIELKRLRLRADDDPQTAAVRLATEEARRPFDLAAGPLLRALLIQLADEEYFLLLLTHHIVSDGMSLILLVRELSVAYEALVKRREPVLSDLPVQYAQFAHWQRCQFEGAAWERELRYWKEQLAGVPALDLPTDRGRPAIQSSRGATAPFQVPIDTARQVKSFGRQRGVTTFMTLLAAFKALLHRYSHQSDILVGTAVSNRNRVELENLIGSFSNNLALRTRFNGDCTFEQLLEKVRDTALGAYAHQEAPFETVLDAVTSNRDPGRNPLFQVLFVLHEQQLSLQWPGIESERVPIELNTAKFDLSIDIWDGSHGLSGALEYNTDLFDSVTVERFVRHYHNLLQSCLRRPGERISKLPLLSDDERHCLLNEWNATEAPVPQVQLDQLIHQQARRSPEARAIVCGDRAMTYRELDDSAEMLAAELRQRGISDQALAGIYVDRSVEMIVGLLGILKAGAAYVPLDPSYPARRLQVMVDDAAIQLLLTQQPLGPPPELGRCAPILYLDEFFSQLGKSRIAEVDGLGMGARLSSFGESSSDTWGGERKRGPDLAAPHAKDCAPTQVHPSRHEGECQRLAYVIYTSGSTGKPKGVQITHGAVVNLLLSMARQFRMSASGRLLAVTTIGFDIAVLELFLPLITGAELTIAPRQTASDGQKLIAAMDRCRPTVMQATPATWRMLLDSGWPGDCELTILCGGEAMPADLAKELLPRCKSLWNMYGPTETTIWSTCAEIHNQRLVGQQFTRDAADGQKLSPAITIGRPIGNTEIYILDEHVEPVPVGVVGQLHIGGKGLAAGYLNRPELTAEKFIVHPFKAGERLYRTGDLARYRADGLIEFLGRQDHQVKIRGFRIELGEIETVLCLHPAISQAAVVAENDDGDQRLVAFMVSREPGRPEVGVLREFLRTLLPIYMVPSAFVYLDELPRLPNGKFNRGALPKATQPAVSGTSFVPPRTLVEEGLAEIWKELLRLNDVGVENNFFELGGHSLLATRVIARIRKRFCVEISLHRFFESPTLSELAALIERNESDERQVKQAALVALPRNFSRQDSRH